jgi:meso-butanediol dehydrogenase / (S,S)-butanediol dehydrogenase / diacetyl reductase
MTSNFGLTLTAPPDYPIERSCQEAAMNFLNKRILVTGGTRGIGRGIVEAFLGAQARVAVNGSTAESTAKAINDLGGGDRLIGAPGSVATVSGCRAIVEAAADGLGGLDVLVNNAGILTFPQTLDQAEEADWNSIIDTNAKGVFFTTKSAVPHLRASKGNIVNIASISGIIADPVLSIYGASKAAVIHLTRYHALELGPDIRVNSVCPGPIETDMLRGAIVETDGNLEDGRKSWAAEVAGLKRLGRVDEVAKVVMFLASDLASYMTGTSQVVDGGHTVD